MNADGLLLIVLGALIVAQVTLGDALGRLGLVSTPKATK